MQQLPASTYSSWDRQPSTFISHPSMPGLLHCAGSVKICGINVAVQRYSTIQDSQVDDKMKQQHATPLPTTTVITKDHCSATYADEMKLQNIYGFEYAAVVGSLIYFFLHMYTTDKYGADSDQPIGRTSGDGD
jgi:hypothetical protein